MPDPDLRSAVAQASTEVNTDLNPEAGNLPASGPEPGASREAIAGEPGQSADPAASPGTLGGAGTDPNAGAEPPAAADPGSQVSELDQLKAQLAERDRQLQSFAGVAQLQQAIERDPALEQAIVAAVAGHYGQGQPQAVAGGQPSTPAQAAQPPQGPELLTEPEGGWDTDAEAALAEAVNHERKARFAEKQQMEQRLGLLEQYVGGQLQQQFGSRVDTLASDFADRFKRQTGQDPAAFEASLRQTLNAAASQGYDVNAVAEQAYKLAAFDALTTAAPAEAQRLRSQQQGAIHPQPARQAAGPPPVPAAQDLTPQQAVKKTLRESIRGFLASAPTEG